MKMKKIVSIIIAAALTLSFGTIMVSAGGHGHHAGAAAQYDRCYFTDEDGDGVCDRHGSDCRFIDEDGDVCDRHGSNCRFIDEDGNGVCDRHGSDCRFIDEDGDGVCDRKPQSCSGYGQGRGRHSGFGCHNGQGQRC